MAVPGVLAVKRVNEVPTVFPADSGEVSPDEDLLQVGNMCMRMKTVAGSAVWMRANYTNVQGFGLWGK